jgi:anti-anti-sigma factor
VEHPLEIEILPDGHAVTLRVSGEVDIATVDTLRACIESVDDGYGTIVLDLASLRFIDSSGIGLLAQLHRELTPQLRHLELHGAQGPVQRVLELSGLAQILPTA